MEKQKVSHEKLYRFIQTIAIICMFASVGLAILMSFKYIEYSSATLAIVLVILVVSVSCMMVLPWIKQLSKGEFKILCYVMFALIGFSCILWAVDVVIGISIADAIVKSSNTKFVWQLNFLKISLILTFQIIVASSIASCVVKYRKSMIIFQVITYISNLFIDFYGTFALACMHITADGITFSSNIKFLTDKLTIMFAVMALSFVIISNWVVNRMERRRRRDALAPMFDDFEQNQAKANVNQNISEKSIQQQLKDLKEMLANNLITEEEYARKRDELINKL